MKKAVFFLTATVFGFMIFTGQKSDDISPRWVNNPAFTEMRSGVYNQLPVGGNDNYIPTTQPRYFYSPQGVTAVNPSFRIFPSTITQNEVIIVCQRTNQSRMFASANTIPGSTINAGDYYTTNNGLNWAGYDYINNGNTANQRSDPGPAYDKNGVILFTHITSTTNFGAVTGIGGEYSTNFGANFSATFQIDNSGDDDKNLTGTDDNPASPYYGNTYVAWCRFTAGNFPAVIWTSRTSNGGVNWTTPIQVNTTNANHFSQGSDVCVGPNGYVYITWAMEANASPYMGDSIGFARSTNGGVNWTSNNNAFDCSGTRSTSYNGWGFRTNDFPRIDVDKSGGPRNGWIYVVRPQITLAPAGTDGDIVLNRSTDNGVTWSAGIRVNQDALNNGKVQWFPAVRVDEYGGVNVIYYDNRYWANSGDSATIFVSRSIDGGNTWTDIKLSDHNFKPNWSSQIGDYIGITSGNNKIWGIWMDDKAGTCNAWVASIDLGPVIDHTPLGNTEQSTGSRVVNCVVTPAGSGINPSTAKLYYAKNSTTFSNVALTNSGGNNWTANLPLSGAGTYNYYLSATDSLVRTATAPAGAPANYYSFTATPDTVKPVITHTQIPNTPKLAWPTTVTATVTDNIGVDSAWVNWKKNFNGTAKRFKLTNTSGSVYSALFNSLNSDVIAGDSIYYRIIAQDNSTAHNRDSTAQYKFAIISQATACIGTGTIQMGSASGPFNTYWYGNRTQFLYTASEIIANQGGAGYIVKIGFNIAAVGGQAMTGFNINMQHTALSTLTGFTSTGWTNVYTGTYTVPGTGWQYIDLQVPFNYNGTSNLLVEVCFGNSSYTTATTVNGTTIAGMEYSEYHDISTACTTFNAPTVQTARANTCFVINTVTGTGSQVGSAIPTAYSLSQNYPNPFNPVTRINFSVPKQGFVNLKIYDVLGREVKTLVNEVKTPGVYSVDFNGTELSSGVYFYRMESNGFTDIKRMMLIK